MHFLANEVTTIYEWQTLISSWEVKDLAYYRLQDKEENSFLSSRGLSQPCHYEGYLTHGCLKVVAVGCKIP